MLRTWIGCIHILGLLSREVQIRAHSVVQRNKSTSSEPWSEKLICAMGHSHKQWNGCKSQVMVSPQPSERQLPLPLIPRLRNTMKEGAERLF